MIKKANNAKIRSSVTPTKRGASNSAAARSAKTSKHPASKGATPQKKSIKSIVATSRSAANIRGAPAAHPSRILTALNARFASAGTDNDSVHTLVDSISTQYLIDIGRWTTDPTTQDTAAVMNTLVDNNEMAGLLTSITKNLKANNPPFYFNPPPGFAQTALPLKYSIFVAHVVLYVSA